MSRNESKQLTGVIFDETTEISVTELCVACSIDERFVQEMIDEGILDPIDDDREKRLPYSSVRRTHTVIRLQRDLGVNLAGAALALELLDRIAELRRRARWQDR